MMMTMVSTIFLQFKRAQVSEELIFQCSTAIKWSKRLNFTLLSSDDEDGNDDDEDEDGNDDDGDKYGNDDDDGDEDGNDDDDGDEDGNDDDGDDN